RWRLPTAEAARLEINSSVAEHGFGHEEWLFNFGYLIDGKHYAFLQPVGKAYAKLHDQKVNLILICRATPSGPSCDRGKNRRMRSDNPLRGSEGLGDLQTTRMAT